MACLVTHLSAGVDALDVSSSGLDTYRSALMSALKYPEGRYISIEDVIKVMANSAPLLFKMTVARAASVDALSSAGAPATTSPQMLQVANLLSMFAMSREAQGVLGSVSSRRWNQDPANTMTAAELFALGFASMVELSEKEGKKLQLQNPDMPAPAILQHLSPQKKFAALPPVMFLPLNTARDATTDAGKWIDNISRKFLDLNTCFYAVALERRQLQQAAQDEDDERNSEDKPALVPVVYQLVGLVLHKGDHYTTLLLDPSRASFYDGTAPDDEGRLSKPVSHEAAFSRLRKTPSAAIAGAMFIKVADPTMAMLPARLLPPPSHNEVPSLLAPVALPNLGNSCYRNVQLQLLLAVPALCQALKEMNEADMPEALIALQELARASVAATKRLHPSSTIRRALARFTSDTRTFSGPFCTPSQQDSNEWTSQLLQALMQYVPETAMILGHQEVTVRHAVCSKCQAVCSSSRVQPSCRLELPLVRRSSLFHHINFFVLPCHCASRLAHSLSSRRHLLRPTTTARAPPSLSKKPSRNISLSNRSPTWSSPAPVAATARIMGQVWSARSAISR